MDKRTDWRLVWGLILAYVAMMVVLLLTVVYTNKTVDDNNQKWCRLLSPLDSAYSQNKPSTTLGRDVADQIHYIATEFGCQKG